MTFRRSLIVALSTSSCLTLVLSLACLHALKTNSPAIPTDEATSEEAKWLADQRVSIADFDAKMSKLDAETSQVDAQLRDDIENARRSHQALRASPKTQAFFEKLDRPLSAEQEAKFKRLMSAGEQKVNSSP